MAGVISCQVNLSSHKKPILATKTSRKKFREITAEMRKSSKFVLQGFHICDPCRHLLRKNKNVIPKETDMMDGSTPQAAKDDVQLPIRRNSQVASSSSQVHGEVAAYRKGVFCTDPMQIHTVPKRKNASDHWYRINGILAKKIEDIGINFTANALVCLDCRIAVYEKWVEKSFGDHAYCADPLRKHRPLKKKLLTALEPATTRERSYCATIGFILEENRYLCSSCRNDIKRKDVQSNVSEPMEESVEDANGLDFDDWVTDSESGDEPEVERFNVDSDSSDDDYCDPDVAKDKLQQIANIVGYQLISKSELRSKLDCRKYFNLVQDRIISYFKSFVGNNIDPDLRILKGCKSCVCYVDSLVEKVPNVGTKKEKYLLMTSTPSWMTIANLRLMFGISQRCAEKVLKLRSTRGPCSAPELKIGRTLSSETVKLIQEFYLSPDNSRVSPNQRDTIYVKQRRDDGSLGDKVKVAKQEIMCTIKQLYTEFMSAHPNIKVSLSKFANLRPKQCIWGFRKGFEKTCLCTIYSNFKLMMEGVNIKKGTQEILDDFFCSNNSKCMLGLCTQCPVFKKVQEIMENYEGDMIEYWHWGASSNSQALTLDKKVKSKEEFFVELQEHVSKMGEHHFVYSQQRDYIKDLKLFTGLDKGTCILHVDFAQNYSFVVPNQVQGFHWNNSQCTVHPFCMHYVDVNTGDVKLMSFVVISDHLQHDSNSFHVFRNVVIQKIKTTMPWINRIVYVSDGAASQYKNLKKFCNLYFHKEDYGILAIWVFSATSHGKDVVDAISAVTKRLVRLESLRRTNDFITTSESMFQFLSSNNCQSNTCYLHVPSGDVIKFLKDHNIEQRYSNFGTIAGTRKYHHVEIGSGVLIFKKFSNSTEVYEHRVDDSISENNSWKHLKYGQYGIFIEYGLPFFGMVVEVSIEKGEVTMQIMKKSVKGNTYVWCVPPLSRSFSANDFISEIAAPVPSSSSCRYYKFDTAKLVEIEAATGTKLNL